MLQFKLRGGMASESSSSAEGAVAFESIPSEGGVASVPCSFNEGGVSSESMTPSERGVAFECVPSKGGVAFKSSQS